MTPSKVFRGCAETPSEARAKISEDVRKQIEAFLAAGNQIQVIPNFTDNGGYDRCGSLSPRIHFACSFSSTESVVYSSLSMGRRFHSAKPCIVHSPLT